MLCAAHSQLYMYVMPCYAYVLHMKSITLFISLLITNSKSRCDLFSNLNVYDLECHEYLYKSTQTHFNIAVEWSVSVCMYCLIVIIFWPILILASWLKSNVIGKKRAWMDTFNAQQGESPFVMSLVLQKSLTNNLILEYISTTTTTPSYYYEWSMEFGAISISFSSIWRHLNVDSSQSFKTL